VKACCRLRGWSGHGSQLVGSCSRSGVIRSASTESPNSTSHLCSIPSISVERKRVSLACHLERCRMEKGERFTRKATSSLVRRAESGGLDEESMLHEMWVRNSPTFFPFFSHGRDLPSFSFSLKDWNEKKERKERRLGGQQDTGIP